MENLKIRSKTMLATHHSWSVTMRSLIDQFIKLGHDPYLLSTNKYSCIPGEWKRYLDRDCPDPDIDICYTLPLNFSTRFQNKSGLKLAIYNYESSHLPKEWVKAIDDVDYVLPSSQFSKDIFVNNGWSKDKCIVVPHGINPADFSDKSKAPLKNDKSFQFLNVSIPHYRKNIDILVDAYYSAFTREDDVCLVIKTKLTEPKHRFECNVEKQILSIQEKHAGKNYPFIEIIQERFDSIVPLYNACDVLVSAASSEGFGLPLLEGLAAGMVVVAPNCSGQLDFLNKDNSLLVDVKEVLAGPKYQYWRPHPKATTYKPLRDSLADSMLKSYKEHKQLREQFEEGRQKTLEQFTWENAAKQILEIR